MAGRGATAEAKPAAEQEKSWVQEGSRWIGEFPPGEAVASWFSDNVELHDGMDPTPYVSGVTLISGVEKVKRLVDGQIKEVERLVHTPYAKVETRVLYFWDLMLKNGWTGKIEPVEVEKLEGANVYNRHLPPGFFRVPVQTDTGQFVHFIACAMKVTVKDGDKTLIDAPPATKMIAMIDRHKQADPFSIMKAETGAVGRALGMAGILVLPGSGVATAEDMQEALAGAQGAAVASAEAPEVAPAVRDEAQSQADHIATLVARLESDAPGKLEEVAEWAQGRGIDMREPKPTQFRAIIAQLEKKAAELDSA